MANDWTFVGVDLAWRSDRNHTGAVALCGDTHGACLFAVSDPIHTLAGVREFVNECTDSLSITAVDAPLIIKNETGQRPCETAVGQRYGARHASCHTSNLRLYPDAASVRLAGGLVEHGYVHAPEAARESPRVLLEVYPHAALVALFDMPTILKYKKGSLAQKRVGLGLLVHYIRQLSGATPPLRPNERLEQDWVGTSLSCQVQP